MNSITSLKSLATLLPGSWAFVPQVYDGQTSDDRASLKRADGLTIGVSVNQYGDKGKVCLYMHGMRDGKDERITLWAKSPATGQISLPSIRVSEEKSPAQIAADVTRRLLPDAQAYFEQASEVIAAHNAYHDGKLSTLKEICAAVDSPIPTNYSTSEPRYTLAIGDFERIGYGDIVINSADSVSIKLDSMSKANALKIIEALRQLGAFETDRARMRNG